MKRPDPREIYALTNVLSNEVFVQWLLDSRALIYNQMVVTNDSNELHALRGEVRALSAMLDHINESRDASIRMESQRKAR